MKKSASQLAAETIQQRIRSGKYPVGKTLPGQRLLADELGVGRPALREAISALEGLGMLQVAPGRGVFVQDPEVMQAARWRFEAQYSLVDVYAVRASLESLSALLAASYATPTAIRRLEALTDKLATAVEQENRLAMAAVDREFHRKLAEMSGNPLLMEILDQFDHVITEGRNLAFRSGKKKNRQAPVQEHRKIIEAIRAGEGYLASRRMMNHISQALNRTRESPLSAKAPTTR